MLYLYSSVKWRFQTKLIQSFFIKERQWTHGCHSCAHWWTNQLLFCYTVSVIQMVTFFLFLIPKWNFSRFLSHHQIRAVPCYSWLGKMFAIIRECNYKQTLLLHWTHHGWLFVLSNITSSLHTWCNLTRLWDVIFFHLLLDLSA